MIEYSKHKYNIFPVMQPEDFNRLKDDIDSNGYDESLPIYLYQGQIIDGWNRYQACKELGVTPCYETFYGNDIEAITFVMRTNKRRNLSSSQWATIAVEADDIVEAIRVAVEEGKKKKIAEMENRGNRFTEKVEVRQIIAEPLEVKPVKDDARKVTQKVAELFNTNRTYVAEATKLKAEEPEVFEQVKRGEKTIGAVVKERKAHVSNNSGNNEWYTPVKFLEIAREVMGSIDVDPASSEIANRNVKASVFYTEDDNGLEQEWKGNVWMNPPYAQPLIQQFCEKLIEEINNGNVVQAMVLVNNATETKWFNILSSKAKAIWFTKGRIKFIDVDGNPGGAPLQGQAILYFGDNVEAFESQCEGLVCRCKYV